MVMQYGEMMKVMVMMVMTYVVTPIYGQITAHGVFRVATSACGETRTGATVVELRDLVVSRDGLWLRSIDPATLQTAGDKQTCNISANTTFRVNGTRFLQVTNQGRNGISCMFRRDSVLQLTQGFMQVSCLAGQEEAEKEMLDNLPKPVPDTSRKDDTRSLDDAFFQTVTPEHTATTAGINSDASQTATPEHTGKITGDLDSDGGVPILRDTNSDVVPTVPTISAKITATTTGPRPTTPQARPTTTEPRPTTTEPSPTTTQPTPTTAQPSPTTTQPVSTTTQPVSTTTQPGPPSTESKVTVEPPVTSSSSESPQSSVIVSFNPSFAKTPSNNKIQVSPTQDDNTLRDHLPYFIGAGAVIVVLISGIVIIVCLVKRRTQDQKPEGNYEDFFISGHYIGSLDRLKNSESGSINRDKRGSCYNANIMYSGAEPEYAESFELDEKILLSEASTSDPEVPKCLRQDCG